MEKETLTETIEISKSDLDYYNKLLEEIDFDNDTKEMEDLINELGAKQDDYIGIGNVIFKDGKNITIDIASGNSNYYDNIVFWENGTELYVCECEFSIGTDIEIETENKIYQVIWKVVL